MTGARDSGGLFSASGVNDGLAAPRLYALATHAHVTHSGRLRVSDAPQNFIIRFTVHVRQTQQVSFLRLVHLVGNENSGPSMHQSRETMEESCPADSITYGLWALRAFNSYMGGSAANGARPWTPPRAGSLCTERKKDKRKKTVAVSFLFVFAFFWRAPRYRTGSPTEGDRLLARPSRKFPTGARLHAQRTALLMPGVWLETVQF
ncbi:uncharacterized protein IWZ02DRAFT_45954 [Phyllosticta citriasiana]|uniref:uncharacterized protein n=1 Tax=Phyllosticta citriasiana TaxID=595635 RepID=UPI0030FD7986